MPTALPRPPAAELEAIRARALAAGKKPTQAAVLATYQRNQARAPKPPASSALDKTAIRARAMAAGKRPTAAAVNATYGRNVARAKAAIAKKAGAARISAPEGGAQALPIAPREPTGGGLAGFAQADDSPEFANAYWNDFLARLKGGETPKQIQESNAARFGGMVYPGQGPEQNLSGQDYSELVLTQYEGSDNLGNIDVLKGMSPEGKKAWLAFLARKGPAAYAGLNLGKNNPGEWRKVIEQAGSAAGLKGGRYGFGYDDQGRPLSDAELIALVRSMK